MLAPRPRQLHPKASVPAPDPKQPGFMSVHFAAHLEAAGHVDFLL